MKRRHFLMLAAVPIAAHAHSSKFGKINIGHSWSLPSNTAETQVMFPLLNSSVTSDSLIAASSPIASSVELRHGEVVAPEFVLDANRPFPMRAKADHIQLLGLTKPLTKGDMFPLTLKFKNAGEIKIIVFVADHHGD
jgi:periplasmic copper chaperone A